MRLRPSVLYDEKGWEEQKNVASSRLRTPETQELEVLGTSDGWEVDLNTRIAAASPEPFSNFAHLETALLYLVEYGRFSLWRR